MTTENEFHIMVHDRCLELREIWGDDKFNDWWQRNVVALNGIIVWDYKTLFHVLNNEYQCEKLEHDKLFAGTYAEEIQQSQEWRQQSIDERP